MTSIPDELVSELFKAVDKGVKAKEERDKEIERRRRRTRGVVRGVRDPKWEAIYDLQEKVNNLQTRVALLEENSSQ